MFIELVFALFTLLSLFYSFSELRDSALSVPIYSFLFNSLYFSRHQISLRNLMCVVQFSKTFALIAFSRQLCYYITSLSVCQYFFKTFLKVFSSFCNRFLCDLCLSWTACIFYHFLLLLSIGFSKKINKICLFLDLSKKILYNIIGIVKMHTCFII